MAAPKQVASPFPTARKVRLAQLQTKKPAEPKRSTVSSKVGAQIQSLRLAARTSAGALAASASVSRSMLSRVENGLVSPSIEVLERIAAALDVPMSRFLSTRLAVWICPTFQRARV
jgi:ribosome-binding protein aMBF1 (putative translation factor)